LFFDADIGVCVGVCVGVCAGVGVGVVLVLVLVLVFSLVVGRWLFVLLLSLCFGVVSFSGPHELFARCSKRGFGVRGERELQSWRSPIFYCIGKVHLFVQCRACISHLLHESTPQQCMACLYKRTYQNVIQELRLDGNPRGRR
jgi:hypothetical protein